MARCWPAVTDAPVSCTCPSRRFNSPFLNRGRSAVQPTVSVTRAPLLAITFLHEALWIEQLNAEEETALAKTASTPWHAFR